MTYADKKDFLKRYQDSLRRQKICELELERIRSEAERITPLLTGMPGGGGNNDKIAMAVERITYAREKLTKEIEEKYRVREEIEKAVSGCKNPVQNEVLTRRYILGQRWENIAVDMNIELRWVYRQHRRAVEHLTI